MNSFSAYFIISFIVLIFISCNQESSDKLLSEATYKDIFLELAIANHMDTLLLANITREELIDQIFDHYDVTPEHFRQTHDFFEKNIDNQAIRMEQILIILRKERERIDAIEQEYFRQQREPADSLRQRLLSR